MINLKKYNETSFITGMRGYAVILVVMIHASIGMTAEMTFLPEFIKTFIGSGANGVYIFFVISGFAINESLKRGHSLPAFTIKRLFRIIPAFYFVIALCAAIQYQIGWQEKFGHSYELYNILMHLSFGFMFDSSTALTLPGVEWTLGVEIFWYAVLFIMITKCKTTSHWLVATLIALAMLHFSRMFMDEFSFHLSPLKYGMLFLMGVCANKIRDNIDFSRNSMMRGAAALSSIGVFLSLSFIATEDVSKYAAILMTFTLLIVGSSNNKLTSVLFENRAIMTVGTISYSMYLIHIIILQSFGRQLMGFYQGGDYVLFIVLSMIVLFSIFLASLLMYRCIEVPLNKLAVKLISRINANKNYGAINND